MYMKDQSLEKGVARSSCWQMQEEDEVFYRNRKVS